MNAKKYFYSILILACCILLVAYVPRLLNSKQGAPASSRLTTYALAREIVDLGKIPQHVPADISFAIKNTGKQNLVISQVLPDCQCTVADWDRRPLAPGETTLVKARYNAEAPGPFQKLIKVMANVQEETIVLIVRGVVTQP